KFNDSAKVAEWAKIVMAECAQAGIVNGDEIGNVNPNDRLTRAQMSQLIYNLLCKYELISQ
ncbi:MAG: S-layer homology domain-containing protein, partial [Clostridia bacterium]